MLLDAAQLINTRVNRGLVYTHDAVLYGKEDVWVVLREILEGKRDRGDCDDGMLTKYYDLLQQGVDPKQLRAATCWCEDDGYHAVVLLDDENGQTWVLDIRYPEIKRFQELPYKWHKLQVPGQPTWVYAQSWVDDCAKRGVHVMERG